MALYPAYGGGGGSEPAFTYIIDGATATINDVVIGDYYLISCGNSGASYGITVTGADIVYNQLRTYGNNTCTRQMAIKATSTSITIARSQSQGAFLVTKLESWGRPTKTPIEGTVSKAWSEIDGVLYAGIQNTTKTFTNIKVGDLIFAAPHYVASVTGAELLCSATGTSTAHGIYRATDTSVTFKGNGNTCGISVLVNSKRLTDNVTGIAYHATSIDQNINATAGDILITTILYSTTQSTDLSTNAKWKDLLTIGAIGGKYWYLIKSSSAKLYTSGNTQECSVVHFN